MNSKIVVSFNMSQYHAYVHHIFVICYMHIFPYEILPLMHFVDVFPLKTMRMFDDNNLTLLHIIIYFPSYNFTPCIYK